MRRLYFIASVVLALVGAGVVVSSHAQMTTLGVGSKGGSSGYSGPGDIVSGAVAWWGLRAYNSAYAASTGKMISACLPLDATCSDILSDTSGNLNTGLLTILGCNNSTAICTIKTWYDQTGNGHDLTQATIANRATLTLSGLGSLPISVFNGTSDSYTDVGTTPLGNNPFTYAGVGQSANHTGRFMRHGGTQVPTVSSSGSGNWAAFSSLGSITTAATDGSFHAFVAVFNAASSVFRIDTTENTASVTSFNPGTAAFVMGFNTVNTWWQGNIQEAGAWTAVAFNSTQRANMTSNAKAYWGF